MSESLNNGLKMDSPPIFTIVIAIIFHSKENRNYTHNRDHNNRRHRWTLTPLLVLHRYFWL